ncbi:SESQ1 protein, partial [Turnix velox]|nr:SESQ1 protein [Turnix velox]
MKLNERSLAFYATCDSPADMAGFLHKRGERHTAYHRRWFVLRGNMLFYFEERESREPVGVIVLEGCTVELCESSAEEFAFAIRFSGAKCRTYVLAADSQPAMEAWVKSISRASFDYMRLVVRELEKQLEEMRCGLAAGHGGNQESASSWRMKPMVGPERCVERPPPLLKENVERPPPLPLKENGCAVWNNTPGRAESPPDGEHDEEENPQPPPLPPRRWASRNQAAEGMSIFCRLHECYGQEVARVKKDWLERRQGPQP